MPGTDESEPRRECQPSSSLSRKAALQAATAASHGKQDPKLRGGGTGPARMKRSAWLGPVTISTRSKAKPDRLAQLAEAPQIAVATSVHPPMSPGCDRRERAADPCVFHAHRESAPVSRRLLPSARNGERTQVPRRCPRAVLAAFIFHRRDGKTSTDARHDRVTRKVSRHHMQIRAPPAPAPTQKNPTRAGPFSAPKEIRTPTVEPDHKALSLAPSVRGSSNRRRTTH